MKINASQEILNHFNRLELIGKQGINKKTIFRWNIKSGIRPQIDNLFNLHLINGASKQTVPAA